MPRTKSTEGAPSPVLPASAELLHSQNRVLDLVARGAPLHETLDFLLRSIEEQSPGMLSSILLLDDDGIHVRHAAAPSLPESYASAIDGAPIGPNAGSCGTAAYRGEAVVVEDIATDPLWADYRDVGLAHGLRACWSTPIFDGQRRVLGTFAMYFRAPGRPSAWHHQLIDATTYTAATAIVAHRDKLERARREAQLGELNRRLETELAERERAEVERARLTEELRRAQKIDSLGRLAGGIAHDFNNLLTIIQGQTDLMLEELHEGDPLRESLADIRGAATRAADLTRQLLAFSRKQLLHPRVLDLNASITESMRMLRRLLGDNIELVTALDERLGSIKADPGQLDQVIVNLAVNARDAMPHGGKVTIETRNVAIAESDAHQHPSFRAGPFVQLTFSDTGHGMSADVLPHIFEPFFTTKEQGKGTGLGLAMVYGIVQQSDGWIWVDSEPDQGTTFQIYLPRVHESVVEAEPIPAIADRRGSETVLVVEDEEAVRKLTCHALRRFGYDVLEAANGGEAFLLCEQRKLPIQLLVTDVAMPGISGPQLVTRLQQLHPEMKALYTSGYTDAAVVRHGVLDKTLAFLQKPFTPTDLGRKVREVLDGPPTSD